MKAQHYIHTLTLILPLSIAHTEPTTWEIGAGLGALTSPHYRGSNSAENILLPIPYLQYRGKFLRTEDKGINGYFIDSENLELTLSAKASINTHSDNSENDIRHGMPKLDPTFEIGPSLNFHPRQHTGKSSFILRFPIRAINSFNKNGIHNIGWLFEPNLAYQKPAAPNHWQLRWQIGLIYGNRRYHDHYYSVTPEHTRNTRPAYTAHAGYSGLTTEISLTRRWQNIWFGTFLRYDNLTGANFLDSPLVETEHYRVAGFGLSWILATSEPITSQP